jgi:3-isopropylmalate/(R)-2-methylmalate dehydratase small subunit
VEPGDIVVAGRHFGQSSGRAITTKALRATGIGCVVAETFARTFHRNCFEVDLPALEVAGALENLTTGQRGSGPAADPFLVEMLNAGGLIKLAATRPEIFS